MKKYFEVLVKNNSRHFCNSFTAFFLRRKGVTSIVGTAIKKKLTLLDLENLHWSQMSHDSKWQLPDQVSWR